MTLRVWTEVQLHPDAMARLEAVTDVVYPGTPDNLRGINAAVIGRSQVDDAFFDLAGPSLKLVVRHGIGFNTVDVPAASARGILTANTPDGPTESTAEHAVALLLALAKTVVKSDRYLRNNRPYTRADLRGTEVMDQLLGVVGYGRIGRRVTEICASGLRMRVLVHDPFLPATPQLPANVEVTHDLDDLLSRADFVTLHTPLGPSTHHLMNEERLRLMKAGAYLINASRGPVMDEEALIRVLQDGHLAGVGLDVFDVEPPAPDNPLLHMENVVVTPHVASNTHQGYRRMSQGVVDQILQYRDGIRPSNLLDPSVWTSQQGV